MSQLQGVKNANRQSFQTLLSNNFQYLNQKNFHHRKNTFISTNRALSFRNCSNVEEEISDDLDDLNLFDDENAEGDQEQRAFEFAEAPSFLTGSQVTLFK